jgi:hypothetical protein
MDMQIETIATGKVVPDALLALLEAERGKALSAREWKFRLAGYGYGIREEGDMRIVMSLSRGTDLGVLPAGLA